MGVLRPPLQTRPERRAWERQSLDLPAPTVCPPPLDFRIRIIAELLPVLHTVRPLVRVPLREDRLSLELRRHCRTHCCVACALLGPVGEVEDFLVQAG